MANEEHFKRLGQGVAEWNVWRKENKSGVDLSDAKLSRRDLSGANLSGVNLRHANLGRAKLNNSNLSHADLRRTELIGADLRGADLSHAYLSGADLGSALMDNANLTEVKLFETVLADVDLTTVTGLETCKHFGPSIIDHRTLQKSGPLPIGFLRGIGLSDKLIEAALSEKEIYHSCFISYSANDQEFADRLHADLRFNGVICWFATHDMKIGDKIYDEIHGAIRRHDKVLLILSKHSIASDWVEDEVTAAFELERTRPHTVLFPIRLDDAVMGTSEAWAAKLRAQRLIGDFRQWKIHDSYKASFDRILRDLKRPAKSA